MRNKRCCHRCLNFKDCPIRGDAYRFEETEVLADSCGDFTEDVSWALSKWVPDLIRPTEEWLEALFEELETENNILEYMEKINRGEP